MSWILDSTTKRISIKTERVIGREDFPSNEKLSRKHFEISVNEEVCLIKDLDSTNGTYINGKRLTANKTYKLNREDLLRAGDLEFTCFSGRAGYHAFKTMAVTCAVVICALFISLINGPGMDHGRGIGLENDFTLLAILAFSVMILSALFRLAASSPYWSGGVVSLHFVLILFGAVFLNDYLLSFANHFLLLGDNMAAAKIEFYCSSSSHFNAPKCIDAINVCPPCAHRMKKDERQAILKRITPFQQEVAALAAAQAQRQPANDSILPRVTH